jgi:hypothetical protein
MPDVRMLLPPICLDLRGCAVDVSNDVKVRKYVTPCDLAQSSVDSGAQTVRAQLALRGIKSALIDVNRGACHLHHYNASRQMAPIDVRAYIQVSTSTRPSESTA